MSTYTRTEIALLSEGDEFIDHNDIPHVVTGFSFHDAPGIVTVHTDQRPVGTTYPTLTLVWRERR